MPLGVRRFVDDLLHHRERFRQFLGLSFIVLVSVFSGPHYRGVFIAGAVLILLGVVIRLVASGHIKKDKVLATDGPYAYVRHPLYVGNFAILVGFCLAAGVWWALPLFILFWIAFYPPAIRTEDARLRRLFSQEWDAWSAQTRALIPRLRPYRPGASPRPASAWSFRQSLRQNGEPIIAIFLLFWLYFIALRLP